MPTFIKKEDLKTEFDISEECKFEMEFSLDNFKQPKYNKDLFALSRLILNLLFTVPGTYPDTPYLGINIKSYQFEFLNREQIDLLKQKISNQINTYIGTGKVLEIVCDVIIDEKTNKKCLGLGFSLSNDVKDVRNMYIFFRKTDKDKTNTYISFK